MDREYSSLFKESSNDNKLPLLKRVEIKKYINKKSAELCKMYKNDSRLEDHDGKGSFKVEEFEIIPNYKPNVSIINVIFALSEDQFYNFDDKFWNDLGNKMKADLSKIVPIERFTVGDDVPSICFIYKTE